MIVRTVNLFKPIQNQTLNRISKEKINKLNNFEYNNQPITFQSYPYINFKGVKTPQQKLIDITKSLSFENYNASEENVKSGVFQADLHSHSNHSDGYGIVSQILDEAAVYADELYSKTGKNFTFALTDHDTVSGVKEAQNYIRDNQEKFKHLNFIPGVELSFSFNDNGEVKAGEILAYFIDPDSEEMKELVGKVQINRDKMIDDCIDSLGEGFSRSDMEEYFINRKDDHNETFAYNLHYRVRNYAQIKNRINKMAEERNTDASELYEKMMNGYVYENGERVIPKPFVSPEGFDEYLQENSITTQTKAIDKNIDEICERYFPKIKDGKVVSDSENSLDHIIDVLKDNDKVILGFAHPYFTALQMKDFKTGFDDLIKIGKGKFVFSENYHQSYPERVSTDSETAQYMNDIHNFLISRNMIPIGGRDNHSSTFLDLD